MQLSLKQDQIMEVSPNERNFYPKGVGYRLRGIDWYKFGPDLKNIDFSKCMGIQEIVQKFRNIYQSIRRGR